MSPSSVQGYPDTLSFLYFFEIPRAQPTLKGQVAVAVPCLQSSRGDGQAPSACAHQLIEMLAAALGHLECNVCPHASFQEFPAALTAAPFLFLCSLDLPVAAHRPRSLCALAVLSVQRFMMFLRYKQMSCIKSLLL